MIAIYHLARRLRAHGVELLKTKAVCTGPTGESRRFLYFAKDTYFAETGYSRESAPLASYEVDRILRGLHMQDVDIGI